MQPHKIVSHEEWLAARERHLKNEKALTRMRDMGAADRRELPWVNLCIKDDAARVYHTYSSYGRGNQEVIGAFMYLDITPKGRNETEIMDWVKRHDEYGAQPAAACCHAERKAG